MVNEIKLWTPLLKTSSPGVGNAMTIAPKRPFPGVSRERVCDLSDPVRESGGQLDGHGARECSGRAGRERMVKTISLRLPTRAGDGKVYRYDAHSLECMRRAVEEANISYTFEALPVVNAIFWAMWTRQPLEDWMLFDSNAVRTAYVRLGTIDVRCEYASTQSRPGTRPGPSAPTRATRAAAST